MGMMNPKIIIPLVWLGCAAAYFVAAFWLPRPDFVMPECADKARRRKDAMAVGQQNCQDF